MKIVYLSTSTIPSRTANSIHVMKMCQAFAKNGHGVILFAPDNRAGREPGIEDVFSFYGVEKCFEIKYFPLLPVKGKGLIYGFLAAQKAKLLHPDLVYGRDLPGCFFTSLLNMQVAFESHAPIEGIIYCWIFRRLIRRAVFKKLVVITLALKEYYSERYPLLSANIIVAPDGADPVSENAEPIVFPNKGKKLQVGYVGHLYSGRGVEVIFQLAERCPWADFHVIGGTDQDIDTFRIQVASFVNLHIHGFKQPREAERYRIGCDVLLAPYQQKVSVAGDGVTTTEKWMSPLKIFEYMAAGKAIICSNMPVLHEILEDGRNAILCLPQDIDAWEKSLEFLWKNEEMRFQLGENAKLDFIRNYTWNSRVQKVLLNVDPLG